MVLCLYACGNSLVFEYDVRFDTQEYRMGIAAAQRRFYRVAIQGSTYQL